MSADPVQLEDVRLTEADVKAVLERAVRIEAGVSSVSVAELGSVAREAGISEEAVIQAVWEILEERRIAKRLAAEPLPPPAAPASPLRSWLRAAGFALAGSVAGASAEAEGGLALFAIGLLLIASAFRAFHHRREGSQRDFQLELVSAWAGFIAGFGIVDGGLDEDLVIGVGFTWLASSWIGGVIVATKRIKEWRPFDVFRPESARCRTVLTPDADAPSGSGSDF